MNAVEEGEGEEIEQREAGNGVRNCGDEAGDLPLSEIVGVEPQGDEMHEKSEQKGWHEDGVEAANARCGVVERVGFFGGRDVADHESGEDEEDGDGGDGPEGVVGESDGEEWLGEMADDHDQGCEKPKSIQKDREASAHARRVLRREVARG